jgi:hypothetical protein
MYNLRKRHLPHISSDSSKCFQEELTSLFMRLLGLKKSSVPICSYAFGVCNEAELIASQLGEGLQETGRDYGDRNMRMMEAVENT